MVDKLNDWVGGYRWYMLGGGVRYFDSGNSYKSRYTSLKPISFDLINVAVGLCVAPCVR